MGKERIKRWLDKYFLLKELKSEGKTSFKRWGIETKFGNLYLHYLSSNNDDYHMHNHPWDFWSVVLWGWFCEVTQIDELTREITFAGPGTFTSMKVSQFHHITLVEPCYTLVWTGLKIYPSWGYRTELGWLNHYDYNDIKDNGFWG